MGCAKTDPWVAGECVTVDLALFIDRRQVTAMGPGSKPPVRGALPARLMISLTLNCLTKVS